ncbi:MAG: signal peptidase I [Candidatus Woesearchaeota archaeon]
MHKNIKKKELNQEVIKDNLNSNKENKKNIFQKIWYFIWDDDSVLSWVVNIILAYVLIKYVIYPGIGLIFGTSFPIVAVVSGSMEHKLSNGFICGKFPENYQNNFDSFWETCGSYYEKININKDQFKKFPFSNGFNTGDIMILFGKKPETLKIGDVIVFMGSKYNPKPYPIIHRVVDIKKSNDVSNSLVFHTKGDHNSDSINGCERDGCIYEFEISESQLIGKAVFRIPALGYIKIWFVDFLKLIGLDKTFGKLFN